MQEVINGSPCKGRGNVRKKCNEDLLKLLKSYHRVFAVYDEDTIRQTLALPGSSCRRQVCEKLRSECEVKGAGDASKLEVILIRRNLESLLKLIQKSGLTSIADGKFDRAIRRKDRTARDQIFIHCVHTLDAPGRSQLLTQLPDLARLVQRLAEALKSSPHHT